MAKIEQIRPENDGVELATFYVGDALCGMDILRVQEINKQLEITTVPRAPDFVRGIMNLRGQIVTIIDLGKKLGLGETGVNGKTRNIIVNSGDEYIGLLVSSNPQCASSDFDGSGSVNTGDFFAYFLPQFGGAPVGEPDALPVQDEDGVAGVFEHQPVFLLGFAPFFLEPVPLCQFRLQLFGAPAQRAQPRKVFLHDIFSAVFEGV